MITPYQTVPWQIFLLSDQGKAGCAGAGNCLTGQSSRPRRRPSACSSCWRESTSTLRKQMRSCDGGFAWGDLSPPLASFYSWTMEAHESWLSSEAAEAELPRRCQSSCSISRRAPIYYSWKLTHHFFKKLLHYFLQGGGWPWGSAMTLTRWESFTWQLALDLATFEGYVEISDMFQE